METLKKKIIFWVSLASAMAVVLIIWIMSLKSYNFSESKEQIKEIKEQVREKLQDIEVVAGHVLPDIPEKPQLKLPLEE